MPIKIYWLHEFSDYAKLGIMARPRGEDWLEDEILSLGKQDVKVIVSLLEQEETTELGLRQQAELCSKYRYSLPHGNSTFIYNSWLPIIKTRVQNK